MYRSVCMRHFVKTSSHTSLMGTRDLNPGPQKESSLKRMEKAVIMASYSLWLCGCVGWGRDCKNTPQIIFALTKTFGTQVQQDEDVCVGEVD